MSDGLGSSNLSGSAATSAARSSRGKPKPIIVPSLEKATNTMRPTRNLTRSRTNASSARGSVEAKARTSSTETTAGGFRSLRRAGHARGDLLLGGRATRQAGDRAGEVGGSAVLTELALALEP